MTAVVLILACGHWTMGPQNAIGTSMRCTRCERGKNAHDRPDPTRVIGECSPHQIKAGAA